MSSGKPFYETCQACCNSIPPNSPELYFPEDTLNSALDLHVEGPEGGLSTGAPAEEEAAESRGRFEPSSQNPWRFLEMDSPLRVL